MTTVIARIPGEVWRGGLVIVGIIVMARLVVWGLKRAMVNCTLRGMPRLHHAAFMCRLREFAFATPQAFATAVSSSEADRYLLKLWCEARACPRSRRPEP